MLRCAVSRRTPLLPARCCAMTAAAQQRCCVIWCMTSRAGCGLAASQHCCRCGWLCFIGCDGKQLQRPVFGQAMFSWLPNTSLGRTAYSQLNEVAFARFWQSQHLTRATLTVPTLFWCAHFTASAPASPLCPAPCCCLQAALGYVSEQTEGFVDFDAVPAEGASAAEVLSFVLGPEARDLRPLLVGWLAGGADLVLRDR